jgi:diguanylate cyclase (GGDEF)-like protein/PAS domain S-box-containing protein
VGLTNEASGGRRRQGTGAARDRGRSIHPEADLPPAEVAGLFEAAFDNAPVGMALLDMDGRLFRVNPAMSRLLGYSPKELYGLACPELTHPDDAFVDEEALRRLTAGEHTVVVDKRYRNRDGHVVWVRRSTSLVRDHTGAPEYVVAAFEDIGEQRSHDARLAYLALHDALTGVANRALLDDRLAQAIAQRDRDGGAVGVLFCDVDGLKDLNDQYGHALGDELLVSVAKRLQSLVRSGDTVARVGGDEFVVVSNLPVPSDIEPMRQRIADALDSQLDAPGGIRVPVRVSVGAAVTTDHSITAETLLHSADRAMYAVKRERAMAGASGKLS